MSSSPEDNKSASKNNNKDITFINTEKPRPKQILNNYRELYIERKEQSCPDKYPTSPPDWSRLINICSHLSEFKIQGNCSSLEQCASCIPPNSKYMNIANTETSLFLKRYYDTQTERHEKLKSLIAPLTPLDGPVIIMVMNYGYAYLFLNWACSCDYNNITYIRKHTIIITTDKKSEEIVKSAGFIAYRPTWLGEDMLKKIDTKAAASFAIGPHRWTVSLQIAALTDFIQLGYDVVLQDLDIIWIKDPLPYLTQDKFINIDLQMTVDGRADFRGPGNSGFLFIKSNCKTKVFTSTLIKSIGLVIVGRSDQILWNMMLQEYDFRMLHFETLTTKFFISGFQINLKHGIHDNKLNDDSILIHASWTTDQFDKIEKFIMTDRWYFNQNKCSLLYKYELLPDLAERKNHIRAKTLPQEANLKKWNVVRDTSNGVF